MAAIPVAVSQLVVPESSSSDSSMASLRVRFVLEAGLAMARLGVASHELEDTMDGVAEQLGITARFNATPTSMFVAIGEGDAQRTHMLVVDRSAPDLAGLSDLHGLLRKVAAGDVDVEQGLDAVRALGESSRGYRPIWDVLSIAGVAAASLVLTGGTWADAAVGGALGAIVGVFVHYSAGSKRLGPMAEFGACFLAAAVAAILARFFPPINTFAVTLAAVLVLLPGMSITTAVGEVAARALISGSARLIGAVTVLISMAFGVAMGLKLAPAGADVVTQTPGLLVQGGALLVAGLCIEIAFGARLRHVPVGVAAGLIAYASSAAASVWWSSDIAPVAGAMAVGLFANVYARVTGQPASIALLPGVILLVPGSVGFRGIHALLDHDTMAGIDGVFSMVMVAMGIVTGLLMANVMMPAHRMRER
jgi:uncharacterized membrane protein YjjP (DUF1212 family)